MGLYFVHQIRVNANAEAIKQRGFDFRFSQAVTGLLIAKI